MQNALAGGGSVTILPALMLSGMDARAANITSTIALFPAQIAAGLTGLRSAPTSRSSSSGRCQLHGRVD